MNTTKTLRWGLAAAAAFAVLPASAHAAAVLLQQPTATFTQSVACGSGACSVAAAIDGDPNATGWAIASFPGPVTSAQTAVFETAADLFTSGGMLTFVLNQGFGTQHTLGNFRLSATTDNRSLFADGLGTGGDVTANWTVLDLATFVSANGATLTELGDLSILASGTSPLTDVYTITTSTALSGITGFRIEMLENGALPTNGPGRMANGNFVLTNFAVDAVANVSSAVPEPGTWMTMILGFGLLGGAMRRRGAHALRMA